MKINPNYYITSDLHFGHRRLPEFGTRPVGFEEIIIQNWNKTIKPEDEVLMMGDLALTNKVKTLEYCLRLNGNKFMLYGNHDSRSPAFYKECGFEVVDPIFKIFNSGDDEVRVLFTHEPIFPLPKDTHVGKKKIFYYNIHGHRHGNLHHGGDLPLTDRHFDMSAECTNLTPVPLFEILANFSKKIGIGPLK